VIGVNQFELFITNAILPRVVGVVKGGHHASLSNSRSMATNVTSGNVAA
jgi:hypothetical protein